ncbi:beta-ketoacyl-ACP synthase II [bacterium]|nr:beta-ketoacyl-ACP synthase II [bacterium]
MENRRVVITGLGALSPLGNDVSSTWDGMKNGRSGIGLIGSMDTTDYAVKIAGEVKGFDPKPFFKTPKDARRMDRYAHLGIAAAKMALDDSGLNEAEIDRNRVGVMLGSGIGGLGTLEDNHTALLQKSPSRVSPFTIPMMISNIASGVFSIEYGFGGPNMAIVTACATANHSIGEAWRMIKFGDADAFVAGGSEASIRPMGLAGFMNMKALSTRNEDPTAASRPFDVGRDGFVMGEGAGVVVIEELEHAKARGANILAELSGYGLSADAYHLTSPHPEGDGAARCMDMALKHAGLNAEDVQYVNAHGTSTPQGDVCESKAIQKSFGAWANDGLVVSSTKSMTGHLLGAAGGVELLACLMAMRDGVIPPTINLDDQDPNCPLDYCAHTAREMEVKAALSNSFGFGGHNASLLITKFL